MTIAVDFDGTIVQDRYPAIGSEKPFATQTLKMLMQEGHRFILWTVREGRTLEEAVKWCRERGVEFYAVNQDFPGEDPDETHHYSRKVKVDLFIDDRNVGGMPDWGTIYEIIHGDKTLEEVLFSNPHESRQKGFWQTLLDAIHGPQRY